jgi:hypothetical protein
MKWFKAGSAALVVLALAGCKSFEGLTDLEVTNQNSADRARVLQTWGDNENFVFGSFNALWNAWANGYPSNAMTTMADEGTASWGNYDARVLSSEPREAFNNSPSYRFNNHAETPWYNSYEGLSNTYDGLRAVNEDTTGLACIELDCDRLFAYGKFVQGVGHGMLALFFDSAFVLDETIDLFDENGQEVKQPFVPYQVMWDSAVSYMKQARALAVGGTWTMPNNVFGPSGNRWNGDELAMAASSFLVQRWPQLARTPAERANLVDWNEVQAQFATSMPTDIFIEGDGCDQWCDLLLYFGHITTSTTWNRADYKSIGQYDENSVAGNGTYGYVDWLNEATAARNEFPMIGHPDNRIVGPGDTDGTTNGTDFKYRGPSRFPSSRGTYHYSFYSASKYEAYPATFTGPQPWIMRAEVELNNAEAELRINGPSPAVWDVINDTRMTRGGLPDISGASAAVTMDAIIYERRIEDYESCHGCAYFHRRSEGALANTQGYTGNDPAGLPGGFDKDGNPIQHHQGLVEGTPLHFAPPGKELEVLQLPIWTYGGVGSEGPGVGRAPTNAAAYDRAMARTHSISAFYIPVEESLQRKAQRVSKTTALVRRYVE